LKASRQTGLTGAELKSTTRSGRVLATSAEGSHDCPAYLVGKQPGPYSEGKRSVKLGSLTRHVGVAALAWLLVAACGGSVGGGSASCSASAVKTATSASACGGVDALTAAAKAEGKLNVIALP